MDEYIQIITTVPNKIIANKITRKLLEERLASCVQISSPIKSYYWWEGKIQKSKEWICIIKSHKNLFPKINDQILNIHPYKVPEIITISIKDGNSDYLEWIKNETNIM